MKTALITTTINIPHVLKLYRACGPDVAFFVAGDKKTPADAAMGSDAPHYMSPDYQQSLGYACSDLIGWNTISRRNIALLEALKWGAEIIVTCDDDNSPMSTDYFDRFEMVLGASFSGLSVRGVHGWFDPGVLAPNEDLGHYARQRGYPHAVNSAWTAGFAVDAKVGVAQGLVLGDPDTAAVDRMAYAPQIENVTELARAGVVVDPSTHTVFNSQNTAFPRELAPCFLMVPQFGRYDDIFASLIAQRVMRERGLHVHFGQPFVWQQRNPHNLINDLKVELWGMERVTQFAYLLDQFELVKTGNPLSWVRGIYSIMADWKWVPPGVSELGLAWCEDVEKVL